jgi:alpha-L-fucosidase
MNSAEGAALEYEPTLKSVSRHRVPEWYHDAKFGIFIHWSLSCVPAYAPCDQGDILEILRRGGPRELMKNQPYSEWYLNSLRIEGSPVHRHHLEKYGAEFDYYRFAEEFNGALDRWDPEDWADLFAAAGARYVVPVTKHHDGFLLWPSRQKNPHRPGCQATRDVVGELTEAVKARGLRMGFYYSSLLDWTFTDEPLRDYADLGIVYPAGEEYLRYVRGHWRELIDRYEPSLLWSDIGYPPGEDLNDLFAYFYNRSDDGVINDRWSQTPAYLRLMMRNPAGRWLTNRIGTRMFLSGKPGLITSHYDYTTPEYTSFSEISSGKWECVRGMGLSFGYNREESPDDFMTYPELVRLLVDIVSKNGNLLLNVGPRVGGEIPAVQRKLLEQLGAWLAVNGEAIYGTRPWSRAEGKCVESGPVRFTSKGDTLYAVLLGTPEVDEVTIRSLQVTPGAKVRLLGSERELQWEQVADALRITLPKPLVESPAHAFGITPAPAA